jgi:RND family efflux transporter MFP subunit
MPPSPVRFTEAREHLVRKSIRLPGSVESPNSSLVATEVEGLVQKLQAREGSVVRKGQVLARLSTTNLDLQLEAFQAQLKEAEARLELADSNLVRARDLFDSEVIPQQQLDDAFSEFTAWQGRVEALTAQIKKIETDLDRCSIRAPFAGVVVSEEIEVGEWLAVGQAVVEMLSLEKLEVRVQVPEKYFRNLVPEAGATVTFESLPGLEVAGKLTAIIPRADPQARTFPVKVTIPNREGRVGAGMLAQVALPAGESYRATVVPKDAVVTQGPASFVYVLNGDNTVSQTAVEPGDGTGSWIVVQGAVEPGYRVITRGNERLQEGQAVQGEALEYELP